MALLQQTSAQPFGIGASSYLNETHLVTNPMVHALEQPINNVLSETKQMVGGLGVAVHHAVGLVPYFLGGWLAWTALDMYFPNEMRSVERSWTRATKRMRIR